MKNRVTYSLDNFFVYLRKKESFELNKDQKTFLF